MPYCPERKLAFCHIPRTGGVSVATAMNLVVKDKHFKASYYRETFPDYKLFTIVRPYEDRVRSAFGYGIPQDKRREMYATFDDMVEAVMKVGADNIGLMIKPNEYFLDCEVDFTLRFDHIQQDLDAMLLSIGFPSVQLVKCNSFKQ